MPKIRKDLLRASEQPHQLLESLAPKGQNPRYRQYRAGYEDLFNMLPILQADDPNLEPKVHFTSRIVKEVAEEIKDHGWLRDEPPGQFARTIVGIEEKRGEGTELVVAHWGEGFSSPIHGHSTGYMHEEVLSGRLRVNTYRMIHPESNTVRLVETRIVGPGTFASKYEAPDNYHFPRPILVHNFTALEATHTLHYLPEHTRDGRDNMFIPEYFEDAYNLDAGDVRSITPTEGFDLPPGEVVLVRSINVPEYGDHFIVVTGPKILKPHGIRPQETSIYAPHAAGLLDQYQPIRGLVLLKLRPRARQAFLDFHGITMENNKVLIPQPTALTV